MSTARDEAAIRALFDTMGEAWGRADGEAFGPDVGARVLAERAPRPDLSADPDLPFSGFYRMNDLMAATLKASRWLDDPANRSEAADTLGVEAYVNAPPEEIRGRLTGV